MALAAALHRTGRAATVFEQAPRLGEVGSGLGILPGAVKALRAIGVEERMFAEEAAALQWMFISNHLGKELSRLNLAALFQGIGTNGYIVRRSALHRAIAACVDSQQIETCAQVVNLIERESHVDVYLSGREAPIQADLVVGADGLRSVVRRKLWGDQPPRYAGETIFRAIAEHTTAPDSREVFGEGRRFGYYDIGRGQTYYWATSPEPPATQIPMGDRKAYLRRHFSHWLFDIPMLIAATPANEIIQNDIFDRDPLSTWHRGGVVLLGDAAHPMTPNLGQGACMAIEDAVVLARALQDYKELEQALSVYEAARLARTKWITKLSRIWGRVGLWRAAPLTWLRDRFYQMTPDAIFLKILRSQYSYDPGHATTSPPDSGETD